MSNEPIFTFQQVVCSPSAVRDAFAAYPTLQKWWQIILLLHGKPRSPHMAGRDRVRCIADGFGFYAWLYRMLSIVFLALAGMLALLQGMGSETVSLYWCGASALGSCYLWIVSGLGYHGARAYRQALAQSVSLLVFFMVMIVAFPSLFVAALSVVAHQQGWMVPAIWHHWAPCLSLGSARI